MAIDLGTNGHDGRLCRRFSGGLKAELRLHGRTLPVRLVALGFEGASLRAMQPWPEGLCGRRGQLWWRGLDHAYGLKGRLTDVNGETLRLAFTLDDDMRTALLVALSRRG